MNNFTY